MKQPTIIAIGFFLCLSSNRIQAQTNLTNDHVIISTANISKTTPYTLDQLNADLAIQNNKLANLNNRINTVSSNNDDGSNSAALSQLEDSKTNVQNEIKRLEGIKISVLYAQKNNFPEVPITGNKEQDDITRNQAKENYYTTHQLIVEKVQIKQADFDLLPQPKKDNILAHPELYEIVNN